MCDEGLHISKELTRHYIAAYFQKFSSSPVLTSHISWRGILYWAMNLRSVRYSPHLQVFGFGCFKPKAALKSHTEPWNTESGLISSIYYVVGSNSKSAGFQRTYIDWRGGGTVYKTWQIGFGLFKVKSWFIAWHESQWRLSDLECYHCRIRKKINQLLHLLVKLRNSLRSIGFLQTCQSVKTLKTTQASL